MPVFANTKPDSGSKSPVNQPENSVIGILGRINNLEARLAIDNAEIRQSQNLRHDIFYREMAGNTRAGPNDEDRDVDRFDQYCDHLLVVDRSLEYSERLGQTIGSYRLLSQLQAANAGGFYSETEFDIRTLLNRHENKKFLEFGRSCVLPAYRNKRTIELLWQGSWSHVRRNGVDVMFGCASFPSTDPDELAEPLSFLFHHARAKDNWRVRARSGLAVNMNRIGADQFDLKSALRKLPPLIKGYLRLGAVISEEAVIDYEFGTIDVLIILPVAFLNPRYVKYYGSNADRYSPN